MVAAQGQITFIKPGKLGDRLVATAREITRGGRSGIYDVRVTVGRDRDRRIPRAFARHTGHVARARRPIRQDKKEQNDVVGKRQMVLTRLKAGGGAYERRDGCA